MLKHCKALLSKSLKLFVKPASSASSHRYILGSLQPALKQTHWLQKQSPALFLLVLLFFAFFYGLGSYPLANNNEGLYAQIAREMLTHHHTIIPTLNGVAYLEKPPLLYWLIGISYQLFGINAFAARLIPALSATLIGTLLIYTCRTIGRQRAGYLAAIIFASSLGIMLMARIVFFDMLLASFFTATLLFFFLWQQNQQLKYLRLSYAALGLAVLTKGLLSLFLLPAIMLAYLLLIRSPWSQIRRALDYQGILLFSVIVLPWHLAASLKYPGFAWDYFINEQFMRFLDRRWPPDYYHGPSYYYLPRVLLQLLPWSLLLPVLAKRTVAVPQASSCGLTLLSGLWFGFTLLFFSFSAAKANYYMVIALPALALLLGMKLDSLLQERWLFKLLAVVWLVWTAGLLYLLWLVMQGININTSINFAPVKPFASGLFAIMAAYLIIGISALFYKHQAILALILIAGLTMPLSIFCVKLVSSNQNYFSEVGLANKILAQPQRPVYVYQDFEKVSSLAFYTKQRLVIVDSHSNDLAYGRLMPAAQGWFITPAEFQRQCRRQVCLIVVTREHLPEFKKLQRNFYPLAASHTAVLLSNKPKG